MKIILSIIIINSFLYSNWNYYINNLNKKEIKTLKKTFKKGLKYNLEYSLSAIHIKESLLDKYSYNINNQFSIDVGSFMINSYQYLKRHDKKINTFNTSRALEELRDYNINFLEAVYTLNYFLVYHNYNYRKAYASYNCGFDNKKLRCKKYSEDIIKIIKILRKKKYLNELSRLNKTI